MSTTAAMIGDADIPFPPRFWWLKRLSALTLVWAVCIAALIAWWRHEVDRRVETQARAILATKPEATGQQTGTVDPIGTAIAGATKRAMANTNRNLLNSTTPTEQSTVVFDMVLRNVGSQSTALRDLARQWRFQPVVDPGSAAAPGMYQDLVNLLGVFAIHEHEIGNDAEAIEIIRDRLSIVRRARHERAGFLDLFTSVYMNRTGLTLWAFLNSLNVNPAVGATTQPTGPASTDQVKQLMADLLDEQGFNQSYAAALRVQRVKLAEEVADPVKRRTLMSTPRVYSIDVFRELDLIRFLDQMEHTASYLSADRMADAKEMWQALLPRKHAVITQMTRATSSDIAATFLSQFKSQQEGLAQTRALAVAIAIRLHEVEHGQLPQRLEDLVPKYLSAIPADPFSKDKKPLRYQSAPWVIIYSVGEDGLDQGGLRSAVWYGRTPPAGANLLQDAGRWQRQDGAFVLRATGPATQTTIP